MNWWALPGFLTARLVQIGCRQLSPPLAIFLSASQTSQIVLCGDVERRIFPLRIVNLLSLDAAQEVRRSYRWRGGRKLSEASLVAMDGNRLIRAEGWAKTVEEILAAVPLIIMDLRTTTEQVEVERGIVNRRGLHWKLVVVHDGDAPVAELERIHFGDSGIRPGEIAWLRPDELPKTILHAVVLCKCVPSRERPAGRVLVPPEHDYKEWNYLWPERSE